MAISISLAALSASKPCVHKFSRRQCCLAIQAPRHSKQENPMIPLVLHSYSSPPKPRISTTVWSALPKDCEITCISNFTLGHKKRR